MGERPDARPQFVRIPPSDPDPRDRILAKLGQVWRGLPAWQLAWLVGNLAPPGPKASDVEIELVLDRLLNLDLG
jgi:hypothetical protein